MMRKNGRSVLGLDDPYESDAYRRSISQSEQLLEQHNDEKIADLARKVDTIKRISVDIESQARESNSLMEGLENQMSNVQGILQGTMLKLTNLAQNGGSRHMMYLILFMVFVFLLVYLVVTKGGSPAPVETSL
eukprot:TRINITY_DN7309_c0_g2_i1.p1 TRINITY_DN7309_c0_g2~~TRINITY_DN7309_c0_g2_i1.p1  ORF type:complete len:133 (-),score=27.13 TRINITY_DN7309_c0_g2_i1:75-473(-)